MSPAFEYCLTKMSLIALKGSTQERPEESLSQNRHAENERAVHQNDAGGEEHHFGVVVFGNGPSRQDERHETNRRSEHVEDLKRGRKGKTGL